MPCTDVAFNTISLAVDRLEKTQGNASAGGPAGRLWQ